jgi:ADP-heptose:LPS heptosyltransferase
MRAAKIVVSVDTAAMHLAVTMNAPTLCLASAAYVGEIVPYAPEICPPNVRFVYTPMSCQGCLGACSLPTENDRFPCVARLSRNDVLREMDRLLAGT